MPIVNQTSYGLTGVSIYDTTLDQKYAPGTRIRCSYGAAKDKSAELVYVKAAAALTVGLVYELPLISGTDAYFVDTALTTTNATTFAGGVGNTFSACVPATTFLINEWGWAFIKGHIPIFVGTLAVAGAKLYTTATAGLVDDVGTLELQGTWVIATVGGANAVSDCFCSGEMRVNRVS